VTSSTSDFLTPAHAYLHADDIRRMRASGSSTCSMTSMSSCCRHRRPRRHRGHDKRFPVPNPVDPVRLPRPGASQWRCGRATARCATRRHTDKRRRSADGRPMVSSISTSRPQHGPEREYAITLPAPTGDFPSNRQTICRYLRPTHDPTPLGVPGSARHGLTAPASKQRHHVSATRTGHGRTLRQSASC
jgi:hypothetical protein